VAHVGEPVKVALAAAYATPDDDLVTLNRIADRTTCGVFDFYVDDWIDVSFCEEFVDDPCGGVRQAPFGSR
jgi:hypothetical protein